MRCPQCTSGLHGRPILRRGTIACGACGKKASIDEWVKTREATDLRADVLPWDTKIRREDNGLGGIEWYIPAGKNDVFFLIFSVFWCSITMVLSGSLLSSILDGNETSQEMPLWTVGSFCGLLWMVGLGTLYWGLRAKYMTHAFRSEKAN